MANGLVGGIFLYACIVSAVGKVQSWPIAGYPTFEYIDPPDVDVITIEVVDRAGRTTEVSPIQERRLGKMSPGD